jgi:hypothetical protein
MTREHQVPPPPLLQALLADPVTEVRLALLQGSRGESGADEIASAASRSTARRSSDAPDARGIQSIGTNRRKVGDARPFFVSRPYIHGERATTPGFVSPLRCARNGFSRGADNPKCKAPLQRRKTFGGRHARSGRPATQRKASRPDRTRPR